MSNTGNTSRINTRSQVQRERSQTNQEDAHNLNQSIITGFPAPQTMTEAMSSSRPSLFTGSQSFCNTSLNASMSREQENSQNLYPRPSFSWSLGDSHFQERESLRDSGGRNVESCMKDMQQRMEHLEGTFQLVTNQLKSAIETLRPSNSNSQQENERSRGDNSDNNGEVLLERNTHPNRRRLPSDTSSESEDSDSTLSVISSRDNIRNRHTSKHPRLPPFTGKETWKVWFNRFEEVAKRQKWSDEERLDEMLPRLQGVAGEFVFGQLTHSIRTDYKALCKELKNRFRVVETSKTFGVQFSRRNQKSGESVEEYADELKKLYDKAYAKRDKETRREDLLQRFLDGLMDEKARFHVEFVKEPDNIDEAVFHVVNFLETKQTSNKLYNNNQALRKVHFSDSDSDSNESHDSAESRVAKSAPGKNKNKIIQHSKTNHNDSQKSNDQQTLDLAKLRDMIREEMQQFQQKSAEPVQQQFQQNRSHSNARQSGNTYFRYNRPRSNRNYQNGCFHCGELDHFRRSCPKLRTDTTDKTNSTSSNVLGQNGTRENLN
ncbi:MAG: zinc finger CCHC domain-containing protein [Candidatus Thiodiazotropha sp.]